MLVAYLLKGKGPVVQKEKANPDRQTHEGIARELTQRGWGRGTNVVLISPKYMARNSRAEHTTAVTRRKDGYGFPSAADISVSATATPTA
jgi:hypothetical protein